MRFIVSDGDGFEEWGMCSLIREERMKFDELRDARLALISMDVRLKDFIKPYANCLIFRAGLSTLPVGALTDAKNCYLFDDRIAVEQKFEAMLHHNSGAALQSKWLGFERVE